MIKQSIAISIVAVFMFPALAQFCAGQDQVEPATKSKVPVKAAEKFEKQAYLGVGVMPLHPALASQLAETIGDGRGVLVANVAEESPAAIAGLKVYDVLVAFDQQDVYSTEQLVKLIRDSKPASKISLKLVRNGKQQEASVVLGEAPTARDSGRQTMFRMPLEDRFPLPELFSRDRLLENMPDPENWSQFESLNITKDKNGKYEAKISFKDEDKTLERTFVGTRDELVKAIEEDKELPQSARDHLMRGLDMKIHIRELFDPDQFFQRQRREPPTELFNWPEFDF